MEVIQSQGVSLKGDEEKGHFKDTKAVSRAGRGWPESVTQVASDLIGNLYDSALERQSSSHQAFTRGCERKLAGRETGLVENQANSMKEPCTSCKTAVCAHWC